AGLTTDGIAGLVGADAASAPMWAHDPRERARAVLGRAETRVIAGLAGTESNLPVLKVNRVHSRVSALPARYRLDDARLADWGAHEGLARETAARVQAAVSDVASEIWPAVLKDTSAVFLTFPDLAALIDGYRSRLNRTTFDWGLPNHISLLYPF